MVATRGGEIHSEAPLNLTNLTPPLVIVPIRGWSRASKKALRFAMELSPDVTAVQIEVTPGDCEDLRGVWQEGIVDPAQKVGRPVPQLEIISSPYRRILTPLLDFVLRQANVHPDRQVAIVIPEIVEDRWFNYVLHNQRAAALKTLLYLFDNRQIMVVNLPWYLRADECDGPSRRTRSAR